MCGPQPHAQPPLFTPRSVPECRPFCFAADRDQIFFYEYDKKHRRQTTWVYDVKTNRFIDLEPDVQPDGVPAVAEYVDGQGAVFAVIDRKTQWVYSFKHNTWAPLPLTGDRPNFQAGPYGQVVYVAKYGVLVCVSGRTAVMRPDVSKLNWAKGAEEGTPGAKEEPAGLD